MNQDDKQLFGILKKSMHPKSNFIIKLVKTGFNYNNISKKLQPLLEGKCVAVGAYEIPGCPSYILIWASSKVITSIRETITHELKSFRQVSIKMDENGDCREVKYDGNFLITCKDIPASFLMSYVIADVCDSYTRKITKSNGPFDLVSVVIENIQIGRSGKWSDSMATEDMFKFLEKRVPKFKSKHLSYFID